MKFSHFFIDRPIFAAVISIVFVLLGAIGYSRLPVTQYPEIVPPTVIVWTSYPGASAEIVKETVATPLEQEINGVEGMIYMESQCTNDGTMRIAVTFKTGTDANLAQILVQNRVNVAMPRLPEEVNNMGVGVKKQSPDFILLASLYSPDNSRGKLYLTNYAITQIKDRLARIEGVSEIQVFGAKEFSMRIWLDPDRLAHLNLSAREVVNALREQNKQVAAGKINQPPLDYRAPHELIINTQGRFKSAEEFGNIIVKYKPDGKIIRLKEVADVDLDSYTYGNESYLNGNAAVTMGFAQLPGTNAIETAKKITRALEEISKDFPTGVGYLIGIDYTTYISDSVIAVYSTIIEAIFLVIIVIMVFLQSWRVAIIPIFAIPVSLIGTFIVMYLFGFTLNNLTLFGLVLAIGIVVDDAIVVVENVERNMRDNLSVRDATKKAMTQVQGALIAIVLVLSCVFVPTAFIPGISGQFYKQFALTIATSTVISGIVSLTLTPALCVLLLKDENTPKDWFTKIWDVSLGKLFHYFNVAFDWVSAKYGSFVAGLTRFSLIVVLIYAGLMWATVWSFNSTAKGFIPKQDRGYLNATLQLPDGASFYRTEETVLRIVELLSQIEGVGNVTGVAGFSGATRTPAANCATFFFTLEEKRSREKRGLSSDVIAANISKLINANVKEGTLFVLAPPAVNGIGIGGDFKFYVQDCENIGITEMDKYTKLLMAKINELPEVAMAFTTYRITSPQLYAEIDRERAQKLNVPIGAIFETMQYNLGSIYVNDFNILGRVYKVVAQAKNESRRDINDIYNLRVPNSLGESVMLGSVADIKRIVGPDRSVRFNLYPAAEIQGNLADGYSTGQAIAAIEKLSREVLPPSMGIDWTDLAFQEKQTGNEAIWIFAFCVLAVFLVLAALYESLALPLAVILVVPLVLLFAVLGINLRGFDNNIMSQVGFVVLIGLACKNAILIVEFAKQREDKGEKLVSAVSNASKNRLRPILMTSFAFILGVVPLAFASGAGSELREALGTSVLFGMIGVTFFGLVITPVAYYLIRRLVGKKTKEISK